MSGIWIYIKKTFAGKSLLLHAVCMSMRDDIDFEPLPSELITEEEIVEEIIGGTAKRDLICNALPIN